MMQQGQSRRRPTRRGSAGVKRIILVAVALLAAGMTQAPVVVFAQEDADQHHQAQSEFGGGVDGLQHETTVEKENGPSLAEFRDEQRIGRNAGPPDDDRKHLQGDGDSKGGPSVPDHRGGSSSKLAAKHREPQFAKKRLSKNSNNRILDAVSNTATTTTTGAAAAPPLPPTAGAIEINARTFHTHVSDGSLWLLEFYAPWCSFCQQFAGTYEHMARHFHEQQQQQQLSKRPHARRIKVGKINADVEKALAARFMVAGYPSFFLVDGWTVYDMNEINVARSFRAMVDFCNGGYQQHDAINFLESPLGPVGLLQGQCLRLGYAASDLYEWLLQRGSARSVSSRTTSSSSSNSRKAMDSTAGGMPPILAAAILLGGLFFGGLLLILFLVMLLTMVPHRLKRD